MTLYMLCIYVCVICIRKLYFINLSFLYICISICFSYYMFMLFAKKTLFHKSLFSLKEENVMLISSSLFHKI